MKQAPRYFTLISMVQFTIAGACFLKSMEIGTMKI